VIIELAGSYDQVVKFLPALTIDEETLLRGIEVVGRSWGRSCNRKKKN
jgi:diaminobutyrate-2-oxoglutarate transaminase